MPPDPDGWTTAAETVAAEPSAEIGRATGAVMVEGPLDSGTPTPTPGVPDDEGREFVEFMAADRDRLGLAGSHDSGLRLGSGSCRRITS